MKTLKPVRRRLLAGIGIGAAAALVSSEAKANTAFSSYAFPAAGAPTSRTLPVRLSDIVNVKDYGATGSGYPTDDSSAIQAAINAAFGTSGSPNGTSATLNKALFFPNGNYYVSTALVFTQVRGAHIYGSGQLTTTITSGSNGNGVVSTTGMDYCHFEDIAFTAGSGTGPVFELDWNGSGSVGLQNNLFTNCQFQSADGIGLRLANSGNAGNNNTFVACNFSGSLAGLKVIGTNATGNVVSGGGCSSASGSAFWVYGGQISTINDVGMSGNNQDIELDTATTMLLKGIRTESANFLLVTNTGAVVVIEGLYVSDTVKEICHAAGTVGSAQAKIIIDSLNAYVPGGPTFLCSTDSTKQASIYFRGCAITDANNIATIPNLGSCSISSGVVTWTAHGITADNAEVVFSNSPPSPFVAGTIYYVRSSTITTNTFQVSATSGGSVIGSGTGSCNVSTYFLKGFAGSLAQRI